MFLCVGGRGRKGRTCGCGKRPSHAPSAFPSLQHLPPSSRSMIPGQRQRRHREGRPREGQCRGGQGSAGLGAGRTGPSIWGDKRNIGARGSRLEAGQCGGPREKPPWVQNARATVLTQQQGDAALRLCPAALGVFDLGGASAWGGWRSTGRESQPGTMQGSLKKILIFCPASQRSSGERKQNTIQSGTMRMN